MQRLTVYSTDTMTNEAKRNNKQSVNMAHPEADLAAVRPALDTVWQQLLAEEAAQEIAPLKDAGETGYPGRPANNRESGKSRREPRPAAANQLRQFSENGSLVHHYAAANRPWRPEPTGSDRQKELWGYNYSTQDRFLSACLQRSVIVDLHLKNESIQSAYIRAYDNWSLLVETEADGNQALIFKSAIMAVLPRKPVLATDAFKNPPTLSHRPFPEKNHPGLRPS